MEPNNNINNINLYVNNNDPPREQPNPLYQSNPPAAQLVNDLPSPSQPPPEELPSYDDAIRNEKQQISIVIGNNTNSEPYAIAPGQEFPKHSVKVRCSHCNEIIDTKVSYENSDCTYGCCIILWCLTCIFCFLPFCLNSCKDCVHYCPNCHMEVGRKTV